MANAYKIVAITDFSDGKSNELCFKSALITFDKEKKKIGIPGFSKPFDEGDYTFDGKELLILKNLNECYFEGKYEIGFHEENSVGYIYIADARIGILGEEIDFINTGFNESLYKNFLDTASWNSLNCISFRQSICQ